MVKKKEISYSVNTNGSGYHLFYLSNFESKRRKVFLTGTDTVILVIDSSLGRMDWILTLVCFN